MIIFNPTAMFDKLSSDGSRQLITVTGPLPPDKAGITDAHNHVWIASVPGAPPDAPILDNQSAIAAELKDYQRAGGRTIIDCQPGGCGRDGRILSELACTSGVHIVACTGYHLRKYYPADYWLFEVPVDEAKPYFVRELTEGLEETHEMAQPVRAGFVKIACEDTIEKSPMALMEASALACLATGAAIEVHTEKGAEAERIVSLMTGFGLAPDRIVLCHMDKRPDFGLHFALAQEGVMLEYDTFYRPKYQPDENVLPLLERMVAAGLDGQVALATDMAEAGMWSRLGQGPGLTGLMTQIIPGLETLGFQSDVIQRLVGRNIASRLARLCQPF